MKSLPVQVERPGPVPKPEQLIAACTVYPYEASRMLGVRKPGNLNEVPDSDYFRSIFTFSKEELLRHIEINAGLAQELLNKSYDNRAFPSAFMEEVPEGYNVGWFDGERKEQRFHLRIEDAATDFVLRFWNLSRD